MKYPLSSIQCLLAVSLGVAALPTWAGDECDVPISRWQSRDAVRQMAAAQGWQIQRLKIDDGCYEIRATDAEGQAFKARIDPETLQVVKRKRDKHRRLRAPDQEGGRTAGPSLPPSEGSAAPPAPSAPLPPDGAARVPAQ
jgi:hypothetical protein